MKKLCLAILTLMLIFAATPAPSHAQVAVDIGIGINIGPPAIPVYAQPPVPAPNYIWAPGYWAWGPAGYYWVPGTWVLAPAPGLVWTPGYWAWNNGVYAWNPGYWAPAVGFYGGVDYGAGYYGYGYVGGAWQGDNFAYNTAVTNVNRTYVRNVYIDKTVIVNNTTVNRVSYNGGPGGLTARPTLQELTVEHLDHHAPATAAQLQNQKVAEGNRNFLARVNQGHPVVAAVEHPLSGTSSNIGGEERKPVTEQVTRHPAPVPAVARPQVAHYAPNTTHVETTHHPHTVAKPLLRPAHYTSHAPAPHPHSTARPQH